MSFYLAMVGMFALAFASGYCACEFIHRRRKPDTVPVVHPAAVEAVAEALNDPTTFAVAGKPRKPPFRERKKDLKAAARTERKKREEWKD